MKEGREEGFEKFATGAVRGTDVSPRYDLIPAVGHRRLAETLAEGASKYGAWNWMKGIPSSNCLGHALNHLALYADGDRSEDHLGHAICNLYFLSHNEERRPDMHDLMSQRSLPDSGTNPDTGKDLTGEKKEAGPEEAISSPSGPLAGLDPDLVQRSCEVLGWIVKGGQLTDRQPCSAVWTNVEEVMRNWRPTGSPLVMKEAEPSILGVNHGESTPRGPMGASFPADRVLITPRCDNPACGRGMTWLGDPGHWRCLSCGNVVSEDQIGVTMGVEAEVSAMAREPVRRFSGPDVHGAGPEEVLSSPSGPLITVEDLVRNGCLPDGTAVRDISWRPDESTLYGTIQGDRFRIHQYLDGTIEVDEMKDQTQDPPSWVTTSRCWEIEEVLGGHAPSASAPSPSGPDPGLVPPAVPSSPADEGWEEWQGLVRRVEDAGYKVERSAAGEWSVSCAGGGRDFGRGPVAYASAYLWADGHRIMRDQQRAYHADSA
jgi:hypothetical protein